MNLRVQRQPYRPGSTVKRGHSLALRTMRLGPSRTETAPPGTEIPPFERSPRLREPPPYRTGPAGAPASCVSCATPVVVRAMPSLCWGCGRPLCTDCYWRHETAPAAHRCERCARRASDGGLAISGGRSTAPTGSSDVP